MIKSWPTAAVLIVAILAILALLLAGPVLGVDSETVQWLLGVTGIGGTGLAGVLRGLFHEGE